jgi:hypothetical protein
MSQEGAAREPLGLIDAPTVSRDTPERNSYLNALNVTPDNPPNAALVVNTPAGDDSYCAREPTQRSNPREPRATRTDMERMVAR